MSVSLSLSVNGKPVTADVDPRTLLVDFIRNNLALTGTHVGCDTGQCGACTVLIDGNAVKACTILAAQANGVEDHDHRRSRRSQWRTASDAGGVQGLPRTAVRLLHAGHGDVGDRSGRSAIPMPTKPRYARELEGNLCRCTGYQNIVKAVQQGAAAMRR